MKIGKKGLWRLKNIHRRVHLYLVCIILLISSSNAEVRSFQCLLSWDRPFYDRIRVHEDFSNDRSNLRRNWLVICYHCCAWLEKKTNDDYHETVCNVAWRDNADEIILITQFHTWAFVSMNWRKKRFQSLVTKIEIKKFSLFPKNGL